jgi:protein BCP1
VIKQCWDEEMADDDDEDDPNVVFGITTVVNLTSRKESECVQNVKTMILERAEKFSTDATLKLLRDILTNDERTTGFLINERYINIPSQISVPMLENLCKEVKRANEKKMPYNFAYYVMILKFHRKEAKKGKPAEDFFSNPEEELFLKESLASFEYSVRAECDTGFSGKWREDDEELMPFRKVVIIDGKRLPEIVEEINGFIHGS